MPITKQLQKIYDQLFKTYGPQNGWPAETKFEIIIGAILTQNTNWANVEKAIQQLKMHQCIMADAIANISLAMLASLIKSSGYYNQKAKRLKTFCEWFSAQGGFKKLQKRSTTELRNDLLALNGIGPETADSILLYVFATSKPRLQL